MDAYLTHVYQQPFQSLLILLNSIFLLSDKWFSTLFWMFTPLALPFISKESMSLFFSKTKSYLGMMLLYLFPLSGSFKPFPCVDFQPICFSFTLKENLSMILVPSWATILFLFLYGHIYWIRSSIIYWLSVLKPWNTLYLFPRLFILLPCLIFASNPGISSFCPLTLNSEHFWKFSLVSASFSCYKCLSASWITSIKIMPKSIPSAMFSHLISSCAVFNSCWRSPLGCSIFSPHMIACQAALILFLPSTLGSACCTFPSSVTPAFPQLGRLETPSALTIPVFHYIWYSVTVTYGDFFFENTLACLCFPFSYLPTNPQFILAVPTTKLIEKRGIFLFPCFSSSMDM